MFGRRKKQEYGGMAAPAFPAEASPIPVAPVVRKAPQLTTLARSAVGNRNYQQDALYVDSSKMLAANKKTRLLAVVCDGMGGMADGGKASRTAIQMMIQGFQTVQKHPEMSIPAFFRQAIVMIDRTVYSFPK